MKRSSSTTILGPRLASLSGVLALSVLAACGNGADQIDEKALAADEQETVQEKAVANASRAAWSAPRTLPLVPVSAANLPNGKVLLWSAEDRFAFSTTNGKTYTLIYDPVANTSTEKLVTETGHDMFCPGTTNLADGTLLVNGGIDAPNTSIYSPTTNTWSRGAAMNIPRGYQANTLLQDGAVLTLGGSWSGGSGNKHGEVWTAAGGWRRLAGVPITPFLQRGGEWGGDVHMWLIPAGNGRVLHAGPSVNMHWIDTSGDGTVTPVGPRADDEESVTGSTVMYDTGRILKTGGTPFVNGDKVARNSAFVIDVNTGVATRRVGSMAYARTFHNSVVLPNGQVVIVGGQARSVPFSNDYAVLPTEIFDPTTETFTTLAAQKVPRTYHSVALLLADGRVMSAGGGLCGATCVGNHPDLEILSPPYLFNADGTAATRPVITAAPATMGYGTKATVTVSGGVASFALVRLSSTTHTVNNDQRRLPVSFRALGNNQYELDVPSNPGLLLPGQWMLFAMTAQGTPSIAKTVLVPLTGAALLSNPGDQSGTIGAPVSVAMRATDASGRTLTWSATGLPNGVTINPGSGLISGVPTSAGKSVVTVSVNNGAQTVSTWFSWTVASAGATRYLRIEALSEVNGNPWTSIAEVTVLDADGNPLSRNGWSATADSETALGAGSGPASAAIDGNPATLWHTQWTPTAAPLPHRITIDLGAARQVSGLRILPRQDGPNGTIAGYRVYRSADGVNWGNPVAQGNLLDFGAWNIEKVIPFYNLSLGGASAQSSTILNGVPSRAVDGNLDGNWAANSVTHTESTANPWWQADLGSVQALHALRVWNRTDCCGDRLSNFQVFVSTTDMSGRSSAQLLADPAVFRTQFTGAVGRSALLNLKTRGRYVRIQLPGTNYLSLAEAQVFGWPVANQSPVWNAIATMNAVRGQAFNASVQANDPDGDALTYSATGLPPGVELQPVTGVLSGAPTAAGTFRATLVVTDARGASATASATIVVAEPPVALDPVTPVAGLQSGATATYTANATGPAGLTYRWDFGDGTVVPYAPAATATHAFASPGSYTVTVTVRDPAGNTATRTFTQTVTGGTGSVASTMSSPIAYERRSAGDRIWVANPDSDSVSVIDVATSTRVAEITVGGSPRTLAIAPNGAVWVANKRSDSLSVIDAVGLRVTATWPMPRGSQPHGLAFAPDGTVFVALEGHGSLARYDNTGTLRAALAVGATPRHLAVTSNGSRVLLSRFITPALPGESTATVQTTVNGAPVGGEVLVVAATSTGLSLEKTVMLRHSDKADTTVQGRGIPNYLGAPAVSPDGRSAWVPSKQDNIKRGALRDGNGLNFQNTVRAIGSRIDLQTLAEDYAARVDLDNSGLASAALFHPTGKWLLVALETSRHVAVIDVANNTELLRFDAGRAPQGLALSPDGLRLYVSNFMDRSVTVHDLSRLVTAGEARVPFVASVGTVGAEKLDATVLLGKQLFYDARDTRLAKDAYMSCASCHNDGGHDGRTWDLTGFGEGLRNTIALRGRGSSHGKLHWSANFDEVQDFEGQIRALAGGTGLMSDAQFNAGTRSQPLGDRKAGLSPDLDALASYLGSLADFDRSPYRAADGKLTATGAAGALVFDQKGCASCHGGTGFTQSAILAPQSVGTIKQPTSGKRLGGALTGIDPPTLRDVWSGAPYLHDGSAATLADAVNAHQGVSLTATELAQLVRFLAEIDGEHGVPATTGEVTGLLGEYYNSLIPGTGAPVLRRNEAVDFDWDAFSPGQGVGADLFSVRWTGTLVAPATGSFRLQTLSDDGVRVWLDGKLVIDNWTLHSPTADTSAALSLVAGQRYAIRMEFYEAWGGAVARLRWQVPGQTTFVPVPTAALRSLPAESAGGLLGEYFAGIIPGQAAPVLTRTEAVDFDWGSGAPGPGVGSDNYSVRWTGSVIATSSGAYQFQTVTDDGVRLWIDGKLVIDNWTWHGATVDTTTAIQLVAGQRYAVRMEFFEGGGDAVARLRWKTPEITTFVPIPTSALRNSAPGN